jgi:hypothetical protein
MVAFASSIPARFTYAAGRCNIGTAEIERRRRFGHLGLAMAIALFAALMLAGAPRESRLLLFFPAAGSAVGYLQARLRFCAAFGLLGVFNFGRLGDMRQVADPADLRRDRLVALAIFGGSAVVGLVVAGVAYLA